MPRPCREVIELGSGKFTVTGWEDETIDRDLAVSVANRLNLVDPLPCPHGGDTYEISTGSGLSWHVCADCGEQVNAPS